MRHWIRGSLLSVGCLLFAFACSAPPEGSAERWTFEEERDTSTPPPDIQSDADCPEEIQPRDGFCDSTCSHVDPDCAECPNPDAPGVEYEGNSYRDPTVCESLDFSCEEGETRFDRRLCGCGCRRASEGGLCAPMDVEGEGGCDAVLGYRFDGSECRSISGCSCEGDDCRKLYKSADRCRRATGDCDRQCGDPEARVCDRYPDLDPRNCPSGTIYTVRDCEPQCVDPETCRPPSENECKSNSDCGEGEWCDFPRGGCGDDRTGRCRNRPIGCPENPSPICGCDGNTYLNECKAKLEGVDLQFRGECPS